MSKFNVSTRVLKLLENQILPDNYSPRPFSSTSEDPWQLRRLLIGGSCNTFSSQSSYWEMVGFDFQTEVGLRILSSHLICLQVARQTSIESGAAADTGKSGAGNSPTAFHQGL
jgi:hypothetical protein